MKLILVKFRIPADMIGEIIQLIGRKVGPIVIEEVDDELRAAITQLGKDMLSASADTRAAWKENTVDHSKVKPKRVNAGVGKAAILGALQGKALKYGQLREVFVATGLAPSGFGACMGKAQAAGLIEKSVDDGLWRIVNGVG